MLQHPDLLWQMSKLKDQARLQEAERARLARQSLQPRKLALFAGPPKARAKPASTAPTPECCPA